MDATATTQLYRRRQRRRALIAWGTLGAIVVLVGLGIAFGGEDKSPGPKIDLFAATMSSNQYEQLHKGEGELEVLKRLGSVGEAEGEVGRTDLLPLFPPAPRESNCHFWELSDAPDHLVRLCFGESDGVLLQKSVRAPDESGVEATLA